MFSDKSGSKSINPATQNRIATGAKIQGDITSEQGIRVDGNIIGKVDCKSKLVIGKEGTVSGEIYCVQADIEGTIDGSIVVTELLTIKSTAKIYGKVSTKKLAVEPGAIFEAHCTMGKSLEQSKTLSSEPEQNSKPEQIAIKKRKEAREFV